MKLIFPAIAFLCVALLGTGCRNERKTDPATGNRPVVMRLESLLTDPGVNLTGGIEMTPGNFKDFAGNGWEVNQDSISAVNKRAVLILPELPPHVSKASLKFRATVPEPVQARRVVINSRNKELATLNLKKGWHDYQIDLQADELNRLRFVFDGKKENGQPFVDFAGFELKFYSQAPFKIKNEVRPSILVPASSTVSFSFKLQDGKPLLTFGAGLEPNQQERRFKVTVQEGSSNKTISEFGVSAAEWRDLKVDLSSFAGKQVRLELKPANKTAASAALVAWSSPEVFDVSNVQQQSPNIILFSIDALRPDHLSYHGYPIRTSPNLDAFARKSIVFNNAYCTSPSTLPSHASVMTGLYPSKHHVGKKTKMIRRLQRIPDNLVTLAELAARQNYRTAAITDDGYVSSFYGFQQGFQQYVENNDVEKNEIVSTIDDGIAWLRKNKTRPFFLFLHSYEVHEPFTPPLSAFRHLFPDHKLVDEKSPEIYNEWLKEVMTEKIVPSAEEKDLVRKAFDAEIYFFDQQFGKLLKELQNLKLDQNTVIIVFSDHGQQFFDRGNAFGHASSLFVEEIRVPLFIYIPGKSHRQIDAPVSLVDLYPTVAELLREKEIPAVDGVNLLQASGKQFQNRTIYYEIHYGDKALWGMQNHEYKLIVDSEKGEAFYDLRKDPKERESLKNVSARTMNIMKNLLSSYIAQSTAPPKFDDQEREEAAELNERLRALGYIN